MESQMADQNVQSAPVAHPIAAAQHLPLSNVLMVCADKSTFKYPYLILCESEN